MSTTAKFPAHSLFFVCVLLIVSPHLASNWLASNYQPCCFLHTIFTARLAPDKYINRTYSIAAYYAFLHYFARLILSPPCPLLTWRKVLHGREVSPFYNNLKPINRRPAVFKHNPVADILTQLTASQPRGQMLESSTEYIR